MDIHTQCFDDIITARMALSVSIAPARRQTLLSAAGKNENYRAISHLLMNKEELLSCHVTKRIVGSNCGGLGTASANESSNSGDRSMYDM